MSTILFDIITPHKIVYSSQVDKVFVRTTLGDMGILPNHAPLVASLAIGEMRIRKDGEDIKYFISGGFLEISKEKVTILADKAVKADEIDIEKAREEQMLFEAKLKKLTEDREIAATQVALKEALAKIRIGQGTRH